MTGVSATATAWLAVIASGLYHGLNPAMGWPLAVAAGLLARKPSALGGALASLTLGHLAAVLSLMLPFAVLVALTQWEKSIRVGAASAAIAFGAIGLARRRHPPTSARIAPSRIALWSFVAAAAHGAGLMLVPIFLGMCRPAASGDGDLATAALMRSNASLAVAVGLAHTAAMIAAGGACAWLVYRYLGLAAIRRAWWNTELAWNGALIFVGAISLAVAIS